MRARTFASIASLALLCVACSGGGGGGARTTLSVYAEPPFAESALTQAQDLLASTALSAQIAPDAASADIAIRAEASEGAMPIVQRYWAVAVALPYAGSDISLGELKAALTGGRRVLVPADPGPPLAAWFPDLGATAVEPAPLADIPGALAADTSALALLPLENVDVRVRTLAIDGTNVVFGTGDLASYPLAERAYVSRADTRGRRYAGMSDAKEGLDALARNLAARLGVPAPDPIVLRATGDILPVRCTYARMLALGDMSAPFRDLGPWLAEADITVGSLDASISDAGVPFQCEETFSLMAPAAAADGLELSGFDVITVATNHVKDCGQGGACGDEAFFDTLANLRARNIAPVGGGADLSEARAPAILTVKGVRFAFLGYDEIAPYYHAEPGIPGTAPLNETYLREDVAAAAAQADVVIVEPQWGIEYQAEPTLLQRQLAAVAVESGAALIIGNHPHWVEAAEVIDGAFVAYALGNFVFDQDWSLETQQGVVLDAAFHGAKLMGIEYHPVHIHDEHQPRFADPAEANQILDRIWNASATLQP